jgi:acetylornithine deacetylase/succinyl-diaminopimelate desuccinylase-like protein
MDNNKFESTERLKYESELKQMVDIPSVSSDPERQPDIQKMAEAAIAILNSAGAKAQILKTDGNPVVLGEFAADVSGCRTVTVYNHLDVQPADAEDWKSPPFSMQVVKDTYLGRGTTDDKGPALTALYAAKHCYANKLPLNIKFLWELEEEIGSPSFENCLKKNVGALKTDSIVVSDTVWVSREQPAVPYGLRGLQGVLLRLKTGEKDVHSGLTGGLARNPIAELAAIICECVDPETGRVKIPGFYDDVVDVTKDELDDFLKSGFSVGNFKKAYELKSVRTDDVYDAVKRIWGAPTFEVHGITGGYNGPGIKTIVPHCSEAKVSMRLVPNQSPEKILDLISAFVRKLNPDVEIVSDGSLKPYIGRPPAQYEQAARSAIKHAFGKEPVFTREGGSIGAVVSMQDVLKCPIVFLGLSLPEHGYHAINENYDWGQASGGMRMFAEYFSQLSRA